MENAIFTNMCMIYDGDRILVQDRRDPKWPGVTFPGGHVEPEESFLLSTIREVKEETGLDVWDLQFCGMKQFTDREKGYRYVVFYIKRIASADSSVLPGRAKSFGSTGRS